MESSSLDTVQLKRRDATWTVTVIDPIVVPLVRRLVPVRAVTPNLLTIASLVIAVASAVAFAFDQLIVGALVFQLSFLVDCMDGKLASARGEANPVGAVLDEIADSLRLVLNAVGLMIATLEEGLVTPVLLAAFVGITFSVSLVSAAPLFSRGASPLIVPARFGAVLRVARQRAMPPASAVERELLVFTIAPIGGHDVLAFAVPLALAIAVAQYVKYASSALRASRAATAREG